MRYSERSRTTEVFPRGRGALVAAAAIAAALALVVPAAADITLTSTPDDLVQMGEFTTVSWAETIRCNVNYGRVPGAYTDETATWGWDSLVFTPENEGMTHGIYYCIVSEIDGSETSDEFVLIVDAPISPSPTAPLNGSTVYETTTELQWDPVDGVSYYHVLVSDHEIDVSEEDGEIVVTGANIVWQAITSGRSIQYGSPDPSGYFVASNGTSPPLMSGFSYHWLVFNNFGNNPVLTSTARVGLSSFEAEVPVSMGAPTLAAPADSLMITDEYVDFSWSAVTGAAGYHVYIYETRDWNQAEASFPVWDGSSPTPSVQVHLGSFLTPGSYSWRVLALDSSGRGIASETSRFEYSTETGTAKLRTRKMDGSELGNVYVEIDFLAGGVSVLPTITASNGHSNVDLIPGEYAFHASKADYVDTTATAVVEAGSSDHVLIYMRRAEARMRGVVQDEGGEPVFGADIAAVSGGNVLETRSDPAGNFVIQASTGAWQVHAEKPGYAPSEPVEIVLHTDDYAELASPLTLTGTPGSATGNVVNTIGSPIVGATVEAVSSFGTTQAFTNASGQFTVELAPGEWSVSAEKSGFVESDGRVITVEPGESTPVDPPIVLETAGSAVMGRVTDGRVNFAGARVEAVPPSGAVHEVESNTFGEFVLSLPPGTYELLARYDGYATSRPHQVTVTSGASYLGIELVVVQTDCAISGTVTDGEDPVVGAVVTNGDAAVSTGSGGEFTLNVAAGLHKIEAAADGHLPGEPLLVGLAPGGSVAGLEFELAPGASSILGTAVCAGAPVAGAVVTGTSGASIVSTESDESGGYILFVESGEWTVSAAKSGLAPASYEVVVVAEGQSAHNVDPELVDVSGTIVGEVTDSRALVRGASVSLRHAGEPEEVCRTSSDTDGRYALRVAPGLAYTATVDGPEHGAVEHSVTPLDTAEERVLNASLPHRDATIEGTVTCGGSGVPGAVVETGAGSRTETNAHGDYLLRVDAGLHDVTVTHPGYATLDIEDVVATGGGTTQLDPTLVSELASMGGFVTETSSGDPVAGALVTAAWGGGASDVSGIDGSYELTGIVPGHVDLLATRPGYEPHTDYTTLAALESRVNDISMVRHTGSIAGRVSRNDNGEPISGASVRARIGEEIVSAAVTGANGRYVLTALDPAVAHDVHVSRAGFSSASPNPVEAVMPGATDVDFTLAECAGVISGFVLDGGDASPLVGASVTADNGQGHFGSATSGPDGAFVIDGLAGIGSYEVKAELYGYLDDTEPGVSPGGDPLSLELPRNFARLEGTLTPAGSGVELDETQVVATNIAFAQHSRTATPDPVGGYEITELRPGSYVLTVSGGTHLATPAQMTLVVGEGEEVAGADFVVERATIERVEIVGPTEVEAGGAAVFSGSVFAEDERLIGTDLEWWVAPECAGSVSRASGEIVVSPDYFGEMTVSAREPESGTTGRCWAGVYVTVTPQAGGVATDSLGMTLTVEAGAVSETKSVFLTHEPLPDAMRFSRGHAVDEFAYTMKPSSLPFDAAHLPTVSVPDPGHAGQLVAWDNEYLTWNELEAERYGDALEADIASLGRFAVRNATGPLGVSDISVEPNPFAPDNGPAVICFVLSSNDSRMPFVTARIFNMAGQPVRELVTNEPHGKGRATVEWDGLTDDGEVARNGRYVVEIEAEDSTGTETALGTVVLVK